MTLNGAVDGCVPGAEGPSGRARCKKASPSAILCGFQVKEEI